MQASAKKYLQGTLHKVQDKIKQVVGWILERRDFKAGGRVESAEFKEEIASLEKAVGK